MGDNEIDWSRWPRTLAAIEAGQPKAYDLGDEDDEPVRGNRWLRTLTAESDGAIADVRPGK